METEFLGVPYSGEIIFLYAVRILRDAKHL